MSHGVESERTTPLRTITQSTTGGCQNTFDTTALALTDMEQANIAYGRNYVRLELDPADFISPPVAAVEGIRLGVVTTSARLERVHRHGMARLPLADGFIAREPNAPLLANATSTHAHPLLPVVKPTSFGLRGLIGWITLPPGGIVAEPPPQVPPGLYVVQRFRLATYARGFGLGDHIYSFTLFPDEEVEIEIKTWKSREQIDKTGSSIFDGQSETAESEFEDAVQQENARTSKRDKSFEAHVEASGEASWGVGSASIQAGAKTSSAESTEQFAKNVSSSTQKIANKANRERRVEVTQSSEVKTIEGEETRTRRKIRNVNKCNTLNFNYFQLVRKYETRLELYDVKVRFSSGRPYFDDEDSTWHYEAEEVSLFELGALLARTVVAARHTAVRSTIFGMLGNGTDDAPGLDILTPSSTPDRMRLDTVPLKATLAWEDAARDAADRGEPRPARPGARLPQVMSRDERVIATNAIYADAMLGKCAACDDFIQDSRKLEVESQQLKNRSREIAVERARAELAALRVDPVINRTVRLEGAPAGATIHVHIVGPGCELASEEEADA